MYCKITKPVRGGTIRAIPSKSAAHRLLIAAGLSGLKLEGKADGLSVDITATKDCMEQLNNTSGIRHMNCMESGSTLRFMVPVAAAFGGRTEFAVSGRLSQRPMEALRMQLLSHGCTMSEEGENPVWVEGKLEPGTYTLPGDISSQYVTGLLLALPLCDGESRIVVEGTLQSKPYVDMTLDTLAKAGIKVSADIASDGSSVFTVPGGQHYALPEECLDEIEGDWSNSAFWLVMDAISDARLTCTGLDSSSSQGDRKIADWLYILDTSETVDIDVSDIPDLVPVLSVLASARRRGSVTNIVNAERLRFKESDRLKAVTATLNTLGADITEKETSLHIRGVERLAGGIVDSYNDHRIAMMAATASCISDDPVMIKGAEAVSKSYPAFWDDFISLGGEIKCL